MEREIWGKREKTKGGKRSNYTEILSYIKLGGGNLSLDIWVIVDLECRGRGVVKKSTIFCGRH